VRVRAIHVEPGRLPSRAAAADPQDPAVGPLGQRRQYRARHGRLGVLRARFFYRLPEHGQLAVGGIGETAFPQVEGYEILGWLGEGGMGVVWKALQHGTHRTVALKLMNVASFGSQRAEQRFQREVDLTARLEHPHIARVYDGGRRQGVYFYAMELIDGRPLDRYVKDAGLSQRGILELMLTVCKAVEFAHQQGVIHRDLKPANILVDREGQPHVMDFGLAKALHGGGGSGITRDAGRSRLPDGTNPAGASGITRDADTVGTPAYMSPEQALGDSERLDARSDVYLLGVILFQLLSGQRPHDTHGHAMEVMRRVIEEEPRRLRQVDPRADRELEALLMKALAREPEQRYATAGGLAADLERFLKGEPLAARRPTFFYLLRKRLRKHRRPILIAAIILALVGVIAGYAAWNWYAEWGGWIEVANYDFTRPDATLEGLEFHLHGSTSPASPWPLDRQGLAARWGEWCVLKDVHIRGDVRLVLNLRYNAQPDGIDLCINSVLPPPSTRIPVGYMAQAGGYKNSVSFISRIDHPADEGDTSEGVAAMLPTGRTVTLTFQRQGEELLLAIDGQPQVQRTELLPLVGEGTDGVAIHNWADAVIESLAVYRRSLPRKASPLVAADALVEAGQFPAALGQYLNLADDYRGQHVGESALAKACRLSALPQVAGAAEREALRRRFAEEYPRSPYHATILAADVLSFWQEMHYEEALAGLQRVRALDPQTRLALRLAASAWADMRELPENVAERLMAELGRTDRVSRLRLDGLGVDRLDAIGNLQLQALRCSLNPIESLEPVRGSPLEGLSCHNTRVASLEPLRGKPLRTLDVGRSKIRDLGPLQGAPLEELHCVDCPIGDLEPLRQMTSLRQIELGGTRIKSIEPLGGLPLRGVDISSTAVGDLGPLRGAPLETLKCSNCRLSNLDALRGAPLWNLSCTQNHIDSLEPLRGMRLRELDCSRNRIASLEPLRGMALEVLHVDDNPLTTLKPFVEAPPNEFTFDCPSLPDAELERARDVWAARAEHRHHARHAEVLLALRHHDLAALLRLASVFRGHRYLRIPKHLTWSEASALCRDLGGHLVTIGSREENDFVGQLLAGEWLNPFIGPYIGLRRQDGRTTWDSGEPVAFTDFRDLLSTRRDATFFFTRNGGWVPGDPQAGLASCIVEWDGDPAAAGKQP
jgi:serine/threonine protein kinase